MRSERAADALAERLGRLGAGDDVPALLRDHAQRDGVALGDALTVQLALPLPEVDLAQIGLDLRLDPQPGGERRRRLHRSAQRGDVDGVDGVAGEAVGDPLGLVPALRRQLRVAVAVDERERVARHERLGLAVADDEQLRRPGWSAEAGLAVLLLGDGAEASGTGGRRLARTLA